MRPANEEEFEHIRVTLLRVREYANAAHNLHIEKDMNGVERAAKLALGNLREAMDMIIRCQDEDVDE